MDMTFLHFEVNKNMFGSVIFQMGFDGLFFGRLDFEDKANRLAHKTMEMVWKGSDNLGMLVMVTL